jgi:hypothetical protein
VISLQPILGSEDKWHYALGRNFLLKIILMMVLAGRFTNCVLYYASDVTIFRPGKSEIFIIEEE